MDLLNTEVLDSTLKAHMAAEGAFDLLVTHTHTYPHTNQPAHPPNPLAKLPTHSHACSCIKARTHARTHSNT